MHKWKEGYILDEDCGERRMRGEDLGRRGMGMLNKEKRMEKLSQICQYDCGNGEQAGGD